MSKQLWTAVDEFISQQLVSVDPALEAALADSEAAGLPAINVTPNQGKFLHLLARIQSARRVLEIGTLGGYSTIWLARALPPDGRLITLEANPRHAEIARKNIERAGLAAVVELRLGPALDTLPQLAPPFDFVFIDADKENNALYFDWALRLSRKGSVIIADNVVREGKILDSTSRDSTIEGTRRLYEKLNGEKRINATAIQTVGSKGYDGFAIASVE